VMMWDDHDIMDGWGSFSEEQLNCDLIAKGAWPAAEKYFLAFQQGGNKEEVPWNLTGKFEGRHHLCIVNRIGIAAVDIRTERKPHLVLTEESYNAIFAWLNENSDNMDHLFIISSIPIIYNDFAALEKAIKGKGVSIEDDLLDHWRAGPHNEERVQFLAKLFDWANDSQTRIAFLSGDVHIGAVGCAIHKEYAEKSNAGVINSLISSAIVNKPPPKGAVQMLHVNAGTLEKVNSNIKAGLVRFPPDRKDFYIRDRNFLEILGTRDGGFICTWISEGSNPFATQSKFQFFIQAPEDGASSDLKLVEESLTESFWKNMNTKPLKKGSFH